MSMVIQKTKFPLNKVAYSVRASQSVLQYGVGAMVDFPDQTLMTAAPEYWREITEPIHDERLEKLLHVDYFGMPGNKDEIRFSEGISYVRFPEWYFCPKCRRFQPLSVWTKEYRQRSKKPDDTDPYMIKHVRCPIDKQNLVPSRIITVCECGHIDDFPWIKWVHCKSFGGAKHVCGNPKLTFKTGASSTEGLEGLEIACETCGAKTTLRGAFNPGCFEELDRKYKGEYGFHCTGRHPWKHTKETCRCYPKVMQRGGSSVYFPVSMSSLVIPPYSNMLTQKIEASNAFRECKTYVRNIPSEMRDLLIDSLLATYSERIAMEIGIGKDKVKGILDRKWKSAPEEGSDTLSVKYKAEEYDALNGTVSVHSEEYGDFVRESTNTEEYRLPFLKNVSLIHKIREVQALIGFTRIQPAERSSTGEPSDRIVSVKEPETNWYPAYQVRGEGIFIEFDSEQINQWAKNPEVLKRVALLNEKYRESFIGRNRERTITPKFLLLHTVSHLLIKQLSFECGYGIASLKERLYCSEKDEGKEMSGILIYTASGDSEGTLGGLVRQGRSDVFPAMFKKAIESAVTCSNDPVCSFSMGQGRDSLNLAACYSCTLIPETSCEEFNVFLDRSVVVGTMKNKKMGFFSKDLFEENKTASESRTDNGNTGKAETSIETNIGTVSLIVERGTDLSDVDYKDIWKDLEEWAEEGPEKELLTDLCKHSDLFSGKEKPEQNCYFLTDSSTKRYSCDLVWKKSKVLLFTMDNEDDYQAAKGSDWTCLLTTDPSVDCARILNSIKER